MFCRRYDTVAGQFQGLYETLVYIIVRGDTDECFLDYGFWKQNSKILYYFHKKRMPNNLSGKFFNRHKIQYESGAFQLTFQKYICFC